MRPRDRWICRLLVAATSSLLPVAARAADPTRPPPLSSSPISPPSPGVIPTGPKPNPYRPVASPAPDAVIEARDSFTRGVQLFHDGKLEASLAEFQKAYDKAPSYRLHYNIAQVEYELHNYVEALRAFWKYLAQGGYDVPPERRTEVQGEIQKLEARICYVTVKTNVAAAQVAVDDVSIGIAPLTAPVLVNPGVRRVSAVKAGHQPAVLTITAVAGTKLQVALELRELANLAGPSLVATAPRSSATARHTKTWLALGSTAALGATTVAFALITRQAKSDFDDELVKIPNTPAAIEDARSRMKRYAAVADAFGAATAVAAGLTLYFAITDDEPPPRERAVSLVVGPGALGLTGHF